MQPNNLTALDFVDIKSSIKSYLRTRREFSDYDFEGSTLSYLVDVLAYNSYYSAFIANMSINEAFITSSTIRDNVVAIAKLLNYLPHSTISAKACLSIELQTIPTSLAYPKKVTLQKGAIAAGGEFVFNVLSDLSYSVSNDGSVTIPALTVYEGTIQQYEFIVDTFTKQRYIIPNQNVDVASLKVYVRPNEQSTSRDTYTLSELVTDLDEESRAYFLSEVEDMQYEISFGDGVKGRKLQDGEVIQIEYLVTSGPEANDVSNFTFIGRFIDEYGRVYTADNLVLGVQERSQFGDNEENIESIKFNAPRYYASQYRAVTAQDYSVITKKIYPNAESVVAFGGDVLKPAIYGKVFISIKTKTGNKLNNATKLQIAKDMRKYSMASIQPVVLDPDYTYIATKVFCNYDPNRTNLTTSELGSIITDALSQYAKQTGLNNFGGIYNQSQLLKTIGNLDPSIDSTSLQTSVLKYIEPETNQGNEYTVDYGFPLYDSAPSQTNPACGKEPVVQSGIFYTEDDPLTPKQFQDDGNGNIQIYTPTTDGGKKILDPSAGTVNYGTGKLTVGPLKVIGDGTNPPIVTASDGTVVTASTVAATANTTGTAATIPVGSLISIPTVPLSIPVVAIPANADYIQPSTPGTIISIAEPPITIAPPGTVPPPTIPINSLSPTVYAVVPPVVPTPVVVPPTITDTAGCFT